MVATLAAQQGLGLWQQGRLAEAIARLQRAVELCPHVPQAHLNLALALRDTGRLPEALHHAERGRRSCPRTGRPDGWWNNCAFSSRTRAGGEDQ